ncbi:hypothetical protein H6G89_19845 [Oscillatoria sp. FACHB-1407]|uniref:hypothetical protein n=1 Tax=Oscillatoria sp. FACHB-1407 TaxID=2692847 RepID=UPI001682827B|nr:hypothetical protein [Oscillatoria sp. FACHB-1407]MBD2463292.1 hypothetical protein [Oscillatoria sp. FACHB-1407]
MNRFQSLLKKLQLEKVIIAFLAGILLLVTGCTPAEAKTPLPAPEVSGQGGTYNQRFGQQTELYDPIQERKGGMNEYSDVDPRANTRPVNQKAQGLVENAEENIQKVQSPQEYAEDYRSGTPLGQRVKNVVGSVTEAAENTAEDVVEGTKRGSENLRMNAREAGDELTEDVRHGANENANSARDRADRTVKGVQRGVTDAAKELNNNRR